jgi:hypothetical protein
MRRNVAARRPIRRNRGGKQQGKDLAIQPQKGRAVLGTRLKRLFVLTVVTVTLAAFGASAGNAREAAGSPDATRQSAGVEGAKMAPQTIAGPIAPSCIVRFSHTHAVSKHVHLQNNCSGNTYVKVFIAFGPDSACMYLPRGGTATHSWSVGWPYASSRLDRVELC